MDEADRAQLDIELLERARNLRFSQHKPYQIAPGAKGDCDICGEWSGRLIGGACAPCREKYRLA